MHLQIIVSAPVFFVSSTGQSGFKFCNLLPRVSLLCLLCPLLNEKGGIEKRTWERGCNFVVKRINLTHFFPRIIHFPTPEGEREEGAWDEVDIFPCSPMSTVAATGIILDGQIFLRLRIPFLLCAMLSTSTSAPVTLPVTLVSTPRSLSCGVSTMSASKS